MDAPREPIREAPAARPRQAARTTEAFRTPPPSRESQVQEAAGEAEPPANEQQSTSIRKLCAALGREELAPGVLTFAGSAALIRQMSKEFNDR